MRLRERLEELDAEIYAKFVSIEAKVKPLLEYSQAFEHGTFTTHGLSHVSALEQAYDWLLSDADVLDFNALELFCLLVATLLHDTQMMPARSGDARSARQDHALRAPEKLVDRASLYGLNEHEANIVGEIIRGHGLTSLSDLPDSLSLRTSIVRVRCLSACLSLSDICHADASRAPEIVLRHLSLDEDSASHWRRHLQISGLARNGDALLMTALVFSDDGEHAVTSYKDAILTQLEAVAPYFRTVLNPIRGVELKVIRRESPTDRAISFRPDLAAILRILAGGVYQRADVFIRELVQNALDACTLYSAHCYAKHKSFSPMIAVTQYVREDHVIAVRIDDNGLGMSMADIEDRLLWLGRTSADLPSVTALLRNAGKSDLIATFGIGILSCFKVADRIELRTCREGHAPIRLTIDDLRDCVRPETSEDRAIGTTLIVYLRAPFQQQINLELAASYYFRDVQTAPLYMLRYDEAEGTVGLGREDIFSEVSRAGRAIAVPWMSRGLLIEFHLDGCSGHVDFPRVIDDSLFVKTGQVEILSEGIYVCSERTSFCLPAYLSAFDARLNFLSKSVDLSVSRGQVIENEKLQCWRAKFIEEGPRLLEKLCAVTARADKQYRSTVALLTTTMLRAAEKDAKPALVRGCEPLHVEVVGRSTTETLEQLRRARPDVIYVQPLVGCTVEEIGKLDQVTIYSDEYAERAALQGEILTAAAQVVIRCSRFDGTNYRVEETGLIEEYCKAHGIKMTNLAVENVVEGKITHCALPPLVKEWVGNDVKFVNLPVASSRMFWRMGAEVWLNLGNPRMLSFYQRLSRSTLGERERVLAQIVLAVFRMRVTDALLGAVDQLLACSEPAAEAHS